MLFAALTILTVLAVLFRQTALRSRASRPPAPDGAAPRFDWKAYEVWMTARAKTVFQTPTVRKTWAEFERWTAKYYPGWTKWLFAAFALSFLYLAASGFFFSLFIARGIYGLPLVGHVVMGGLFALLLAGLLLWRARDYRFDKQEEEVFERFSRPAFKNVSKAFARKILFWIFALAGFLIIMTALLSMLPILPADAQHTLILIHKYSALAALLAAIVFVDITFIPAPRP
ncbi:MAG: hypothetical protein ABSA30_06820 [Candidatus Aminicenantales bacterium]|jgi:hypothetical protein